MTNQLLTVNQTQKMPGLSNRYQFLSTKQAITTIESMGYALASASEARTQKEERKGYQKHILRFRLPEHVAASREALQALKDKGAEFPEIVYIGSHDGKTATKIMAGFFRIVCANGLISGSIRDELRIKHIVKANVNLEKELEESLKIVAERARNLTNVVEHWKSKGMVYR